MGVLTFRRGAQLDRCVRSLCELDDQSPSYEILVVDNDPAGSARVQIEALRTASPVPIRYLHEPKPGVAAARNRILDDSSRADVVAFIDDDEWAESDWLLLLYSAYMKTQSAVVQGRVISVLEEGGPSWASAMGSPFDRPAPPSGTRRVTANAGNVMFDARSGSIGSNRFDESYGLTGGEDTEFFARLARSGLIIVSAPEAIVYEAVPLQRQTGRWVVRRSFRTAAIWVRVQREVMLDPHWMIRRLAAAARDVISGLSMVIAGAATLSSVRLIKGLQALARVAGTVSGFAGFNLREYGR